MKSIAAEKIQCAYGHASDDGGDGAGANVACDSTAGGEGAEDEGYCAQGLGRVLVVGGKLRCRWKEGGEGYSIGRRLLGNDVPFWAVVGLFLVVLFGCWTLDVGWKVCYGS